MYREHTISYRATFDEMYQSHASPQSSSAAVSLGFVLIVLAGVGFGLTVVLASFLDPAPEPTLPVVLVLVGADGLARPLGRGVFDFACACALSHPSKSGSPPSSKLTGGGGTGCDSEGASKKSSSAISPHASSTSCSSAKGEEKYFSGGGVGTTSGVEAPVTA